MHRAVGRITSANSLQEHHLSRGPTAEDLSRAIIGGKSSPHFRGGSGSSGRHAEVRRRRSFSFFFGYRVCETRLLRGMTQHGIDGPRRRDACRVTRPSPGRVAGREIGRQAPPGHQGPETAGAIRSSLQIPRPFVRDWARGHARRANATPRAHATVVWGARRTWRDWRCL